MKSVCVPLLLAGAVLCLFSCNKNDDPVDMSQYSHEYDEKESDPTKTTIPIDVAAPEDIINLSASGTANCYIVNAPGTYCFKAVTKGNSNEFISDQSKPETYPDDAFVLWESMGDSRKSPATGIVSEVFYHNGYITFDASANNGNAVIALVDKSENIIWSWHIWVCKDFDPDATAQAYNNNAGTMMDRNLGALSATPGDVYSFGLLYQWGRKDPFLAGGEVKFAPLELPVATSTIVWPETVKLQKGEGTIKYSIQHPTTFMDGGNGDWYNVSSDGTDNSRWAHAKTKYDPCPRGWRVPDGGPEGIWAKAFGTADRMSLNNSQNTEKSGVDFGNVDHKLGSMPVIWYPSPGHHDATKNNNLVQCACHLIEYWSCTPAPSWRAYQLYCDGIEAVTDMSCIDPAAYSTRIWGLSVRCQKE